MMKNLNILALVTASLFASGGAAWPCTTSNDNRNNETRIPITNTSWSFRELHGIAAARIRFPVLVPVWRVTTPIARPRTYAMRGHLLRD